MITEEIDQFLELLIEPIDFKDVIRTIQIKTFKNDPTQIKITINGYFVFNLYLQDRKDRYIYELVKFKLLKIK